MRMAVLFALLLVAVYPMSGSSRMRLGNTQQTPIPLPQALLRPPRGGSLERHDGRGGDRGAYGASSERFLSSRGTTRGRMGRRLLQGAPEIARPGPTTNIGNGPMGGENADWKNAPAKPMYNWGNPGGLPVWAPAGPNFADGAALARLPVRGCGAWAPRPSKDPFPLSLSAHVSSHTSSHPPRGPNITSLLLHPDAIPGGWI